MVAHDVEASKRREPNLLSSLDRRFEHGVWRHRESIVAITVRFAPSPTGHLHLGGARTVLFNWLFARQKQVRGSTGTLLLRLEDTDHARSRDEFRQSIPDALQWLGVDWDGDIIHQSDRRDIYKDHLDLLERSRKAYRCYCSQDLLDRDRDMARAAGRQYRYPGTCRSRVGDAESDEPYVLRLRTPEIDPAPIMDQVIGSIPVGGDDLDDFVLNRSDGSPLYNICCVVDDALLGISHVIRGSDHVDNTRRQALLYDALGFDRPEFAHLPLVSGLSKRHGSASIQHFREQGFLPEAVLNYVARLGWSHGDQEFFTVDELLEMFRLEDVGHSPARVNPEKLLWLNEKHLQRASSERLAALIGPWLPELCVDMGARLLAAIDIYKTRCKTLVELTYAITPCLISDDEVYLDPAEVAELHPPEIRSYLFELSNLVEKVVPFERESLKEAMWEQLSARHLGFRKIAPACRLALIGGSEGPRVLDIMVVLGIESVVARLRRAAEL